MTGGALPLIVVAGPTGVGKSELALRIAERAGGEIVNSDSVQIYRGFDIGSAKPSLETRARVPHHLFDIIDAGEEFNAADYGRVAREVCAEISGRGHRAILTGGTFFYLRALLAGLPEMPGRDEPLRGRIRAIANRPRGGERLHRWLSKVDPQSGRKIAPNDRHRVERALEVWMTSGRPISTWERPVAGVSVMPSTILGLTLERPRLVEVIEQRTREMYRAGLIEETRALLERYPATARPFGTIGYKEAVAVIREGMSPGAALEETARRTRAYAKRQLTWLRSEPNVHWIDAKDKDKAWTAAMRLIEDER